MEPVLVCLKDIPGCVGIPITYLVGGGAGIFALIALAGMAWAVFGGRKANPAPKGTTPPPTPAAAQSLLDGPPQPENPAWIEACIKEAQAAPGVYTSGQAQNGWHNAKRLRADWKRLNQVLGMSTADTTLAWWGGCLGVGAIVALVLPAALNAASAWYTLSFGMIMPLAAFVAYNRWMDAIFKETYLPNSVRLRQRPDQRNVESDIITAWVRRLGLARRPELLEGNQGKSGFRSKDARVKTMAPVGKGLLDFTHGSDFYDLQADDSCIAPDVNTTCYALDLIARRGGAAHAAAVNPPAKRDWMQEIRRWLPWLLPLAVMGIGIVFLTAGGDGAAATSAAA